MRIQLFLALVGVLTFAPLAQAQEGNARAELLAQGAPPARRAQAFLLQQAGAIRDPKLKAAVLELLKNPAPTFMARLADAPSRAAVRSALLEAGLLEPKVTVEALFPPLADPQRAPQPFLSAPGARLGGHHGYPGGLPEHTAFNLQAALDLIRDYQARYGPVAIDRDLVIAAVALHDVMKPWCLQWHADGTLTAEAMVGTTASHHIFAIAEALHRGLPADLVLALAAAHDAPGTAPERVVAFLRAGALLAGEDPVARGLLVPGQGGKGFALARPASFEAIISHLSDHDYVLTEPAARAVEAALTRLVKAGAAAPPDPAALRWNLHRIQARLSGVWLYSVWLKGGDPALRAEIERQQVPLLLNSP